MGQKKNMDGKKPLSIPPFGGEAQMVRTGGATLRINSPMISVEEGKDTWRRKSWMILSARGKSEKGKITI